ncbi:phospho-sugar mutase [Luteococcus sp.]|uniref:phospho-sugar mutase n=1 Tax=Luteococcus sp. TaxID=1969402 RepID=UPI003735D007
MIDQTTRAQVLAWIAQDIDPETQQRLTALLAASDAGDRAATDEISDAFAGPLTFGTAGLRAALGPGPGRMNRVVVSQAAAGFAAWLRQQGQVGTVLVGYDARTNSDVFARDTAEVLAGAGFEPLLCDQNVPTPVVAFGIKHLGCVAGIVVTASHNPPADNGYKVYLGDGSQIIPPADAEIAALIAEAAAGPVDQLPRGTRYRMVGQELVDDYCRVAAALVPAEAPRDIAWVYTAMHGVGARVVEQAVEAAGFPAAIPVGQQHDPDPTFPTVAFPNPEEPGAIDLALELAEQTEVDLVVANDPDADRCAIAAPFPGVGWRMLTGDELGSLLGDDAIRRQVPGRFANSVVSSTLLGTMARAAGREHVTTLTGFKWIGRVPDLAFGYEEAIGYCCDSAHVPDKDGITACLAILRLAAALKAEGRTIGDRLDEIARTHGVHTTSQLSVRVDDLQLIRDAMARLRSNPPATLLGAPVEVRDLTQGSDELPGTDAVELAGERVHVVARPSGTEPKLKCYLEVRVDAASSGADLKSAREQAAGMLTQVRDEMARALGV